MICWILSYVCEQADEFCASFSLQGLCSTTELLHDCIWADSVWVIVFNYHKQAFVLPFFELLFVIEVLFLSICSLNEMMVDNLCIIHQIILCPAAAREACSMIRSAVPAATCVQNIVIYVAIRLKLKASINIEQKNRLVCWTEGFSWWWGCSGDSRI